MIARISLHEVFHIANPLYDLTRLKVPWLFVSYEVVFAQSLYILWDWSLLCSGNVLTSGRQLESSSWIHKTPSHSTVETKLRELLLDLGREEQVLGVQVCLDSPP